MPWSASVLPATCGPVRAPEIVTAPEYMTGLGTVEIVRTVGTWSVLNVRSPPRVVPAVLNATTLKW